MKSKPLSCADVKNRDMVDYLRELGFESTRISRQHYWFLSPFRNERTASFKVNRDVNRWYDFGEGKGGNLIDFGVLYFKCTVSEFLQRLSLTNSIQHSSLQPEKRIKNEEETIRILKVKNIDSPLLLSYLKKRKINIDIARHWCREIDFILHQKKYAAIGFANDKGGFELRNEFFKGSSRPKGITTIDNKGESLSIFEGFFDFLSYQTIYKNSKDASKDFIILNSLSFVQKIEAFLSDYEEVGLFLDLDKTGQKATSHFLSLGSHIRDKSYLYSHHKDFNDWLQNFGLGLDKDLKPREGDFSSFL